MFFMQTAQKRHRNNFPLIPESNLCPIRPKKVRWKAVLVWHISMKYVDTNRSKMYLKIKSLHQ